MTCPLPENMTFKPSLSQVFSAIFLLHSQPHHCPQEKDGLHCLNFQDIQKFLTLRTLNEIFWADALRQKSYINSSEALVVHYSNEISSTEKNCSQIGRKILVITAWFTVFYSYHHNDALTVTPDASQHFSKEHSLWMMSPCVLCLRLLVCVYDLNLEEQFDTVTLSYTL